MATFAVAVDGSKDSQQAFKVACGLLRREEDELLIVTCAELAKNLPPAVAARISRAQLAIIEPFREQAEKMGIKASCITRQGPHTGILLCELVDERHVDCLVVGRCGMKQGNTGRDLGTTSSYVQDHASCNVITSSTPAPLAERRVCLRDVDQLDEEGEEEREREARLRRLRRHSEADLDTYDDWAEWESREWTAARSGSCSCLLDLRDDKWRLRQRLELDEDEMLQFDSDDSDF